MSFEEELGDSFPTESPQTGMAVADFGEPDDMQSKIDHLKGSKKYRSLFLARLLDQLKEAINRPPSAAAPASSDREGSASGSSTPPPHHQSVVELVHLMKVSAQYDDVTVQLSLLLGEVVVYFDRSPPLARELLQVIEVLCRSVDPQVVTNTCLAFSELIYANQNKELFLEGFVPLIFGFAESTYSAPRSAAALLLHCVHEFLDDTEEKEMVQSFFFTRLCNDVDVFVRRSCAVALTEWALILAPEAAPGLLLPVLTEMSRDENHDSLRVQVVQSLPEIVMRLPPSSKSALLRLVVDLARDDSWRVRFVSGRHLGHFASALTAAALAPSIILLADDPEREVRAVVASSLATVCENAPATDLPKFFELSSSFAVDESAVVRSALATVICSITSMAPKDQTDALLSIVLRLLQETDTVKLRLIPTIWKLGHRLLSEESVAAQLCEVLGNARQSPKWRLREASAQLLRHFSPHLNIQCYSALVVDALALVVDDVADVRKTMVATLATMSRQLGGKWSLKTLVDISPYARHRNYRQRQAFANCLEVMLPFLEDRPTEDLSAIEACMSRLAEDPVPNVRMRLAKALSNAMVPKEMSRLRLDLMEKLTADTDVEVVAAATRNSASDAPF